ncbi:MAG: ATP-binding protein [Lentisphaerales bacterium]|nr:MAG: ATP-binding protein [Lentisphaerales bacterium]
MNKDHLYPRLVRNAISTALADTPVVLIAGPRQAGKTTLAKHWVNQGMQYLTLDDDVTRLSAKEDPVGMVRNLDRAIIDEVQRAPELLLAIKKSIDDDRRPGRFLLTGSANLLMLPTLADSLAGRMETITLLPLSHNEILGYRANWIDAAFAGYLLDVTSAVLGPDLAETVLRGGYPEAIMRPTPRRRSAWMRHYVDALLKKDVRDIANIDRLDTLPRFLRALALVSGQMCNYTRLGGQVGLDSKTAARYTAILEQLFLLKRIEAWSKNRLKRVIKTPKLQFIDTGLLATLQKLTAPEIQNDRSRFGGLLESFVYGEIMKHAITADDDYLLLYYRDIDKVEVDIVIENSAGEIIGVEVKAAASVKSEDLTGLRKLAKAAGSLFKMGILLYDGEEKLPLGDSLWAAPVSTLWGSAR